MTWFARSRRLPLLTALAVLTVAATCVLVDALAPLPTLGSRGPSATASGLGLPAALALPVLTALLVVGTSVSACPDEEVASARPLRLVTVAVLVGLLVVASAVLLLAAGLTDNLLLVASARNLVGTTGLAMLLRRWRAPRHALLVVVVVALATFVLGDRADPEPWAWLLAAPSSAWAAGVAAALAVTGTWLGTGRAAHRHGS